MVDDLLKPIKLERFIKAINRVSTSVTIESQKSAGAEELQIKHDGMPVNLPFDSIQYIQSFGNYLKIFSDKRMYLISETLTNISTLLPDHFQRTHKSYIVNLKRIAKAAKTHVLIDGKEISVSAMYRIVVHEKLDALSNN